MWLKTAMLSVQNGGQYCYLLELQQIITRNSAQKILMNQNNQFLDSVFLSFEITIYAKSRSGNGIIQAIGNIHFQFHLIYSKQRIAAAERIYGLSFRINTTESIEMWCCSSNRFPSSEFCSVISKGLVCRLEINLPVRVHKPQRPSISNTSYAILFCSDV